MVTLNKSFFPKQGPFPLESLIKAINAKVYLNGKQLDNIEPDVIINDISTLENATKSDITFFSNSKYINQYIKSNALACITSDKFLNKCPKDCFTLISNNPYADFARITALFYPPHNLKPGIAKEACIHPTASIGENCEIGPNVVIDANVKIGENSKIYPGAYIGNQVQIGKNCVIHHAVTLSNCIIGNNTIIHAGAKIGQDGFGYAFDNFQHIKVPQIGRVIIGNDVEIGANCTIDRGTIADTIIEDMCKIDNLVQIGHNVKLGKGCIIVSQVGISGSTQLGQYVVVGGQGGLAGHLTIGNGVQIAAQSGVINDIPDRQIVGGYPAVPIRQWHKQTIVLKKLTHNREEND
jgi:UDP-3-O-[3-hydroxymyristoyl] glucosamine N-acyltransferase